jgi:hypothetical protein
LLPRRIRGESASPLDRRPRLCRSRARTIRKLSRSPEAGSLLDAAEPRSRPPVVPALAIRSQLGACSRTIDDVTHELVVQSQPNGPTWTLYRPVDPHGDGYVWHLRTELRADDLYAASTATVGAPDCSGVGDVPDIARFLDSVADDWRGWQGSREWRSYDRELELDALHDGRREVSLGVALRRSRRPYDNDAWTVRVVLLIEPGEQLKRLARDVRAFVAQAGAADSSS